MRMKPLAPCRRSQQNQCTRLPQDEWIGQEKLDDVTKRISYFISWGLGYRYCDREPEEEVEKETEGSQDCEENVDTPSVTQEPPLLEFPLVAPVDTLVEKVEHTPLDEVPGDTEVPTRGVRR